MHVHFFFVLRMVFIVKSGWLPRNQCQRVLTSEFVSDQSKCTFTEPLQEPQFISKLVITDSSLHVVQLKRRHFHISIELDFSRQTNDGSHTDY